MTKKAELVRNIIIEVRCQGGDHKQARSRAVMELGLLPAYARNCVAFNWTRVTLPEPTAIKPTRALSMSKDAVRKRAARAAARTAATAAHA